MTHLWRRLFSFILFLFCIIILFNCNNKFINFEEYIRFNISDNKMNYEDIIFDLKYKARLIYSHDGTYYNIYDNSNEENILFDLKYWTKIELIEITNFNGIYCVKIKTEDNRIGWIKALYVEIY